MSHAYNAQGQEVQRKDQAGNVFDIEYDDAGRQIHRCVTTLAGGFDGAVRRQSRTSALFSLRCAYLWQQPTM